jgi:hypothetical protein
MEIIETGHVYQLSSDTQKQQLFSARLVRTLPCRLPCSRNLSPAFAFVNAFSASSVYNVAIALPVCFAGGASRIQVPTIPP